MRVASEQRISLQMTADDIQQILKNFIQKKTQWDSAQIDDYFTRSKTMSNKTIYEMICEIDNIATYDELAKEFSLITGIPFAESIKGEITERIKGRHLEVLHEGACFFYIWHPLAIKGIPDRNNTYLLNRDLFMKLTWNSRPSVTLNAKEKVIEILKEAINQQTTDIHLYPVVNKSIYKLAFRIFGDLQDMDTLERDEGRSLTSALLLWAKEFTPSLKIDEVRRPQDGRIQVTSEQIGKDLDIRLSFIYKPNMQDIDIVMRLLYKTDLTNVSLKSLGFSNIHCQQLLTAVARNRGIIIATGATGTGKSKTVNTLLSMVSKSRVILTVEDPVEYNLQNGRQFQPVEWGSQNTEEIFSVSFPEFTRAFKRHDPDVIFIGELRDKETVDTAFHLAKTGHLVFATLHASRATMVPEILVHDYGIGVDVLADNLLLGINQILVKRLCDECKSEVLLKELPPWLSALKLANTELLNGLVEKIIHIANTSPDNHCKCRMVSQSGRVLSAGYSGRMLIAEVYEFSPESFKGGLASHQIETSLGSDGNILVDAVDKILTGFIELGALKRLL